MRAREKAAHAKPVPCGVLLSLTRPLSLSTSTTCCPVVVRATEIASRWRSSIRGPCYAGGHAYPTGGAKPCLPGGEEGGRGRVDVETRRRERVSFSMRCMWRGLGFLRARVRVCVCACNAKGSSLFSPRARTRRGAYHGVLGKLRNRVGCRRPHLYDRLLQRLVDHQSPLARGVCAIRGRHVWAASASSRALRGELAYAACGTV